MRQADATAEAHQYESAGVNNPEAPEVEASRSFAHAFAGSVNPLTTIALSTYKVWRTETAADRNTSCIINAICTGADLQKKDVSDNRFFKEWEAGNFEEENGILFFQEEGRRAKVRQLRLRVVPKALRMAVFSACHSSPMAGHSGVKRTLFRLEARFWWPGRQTDVSRLVTSCGHCRMANGARHESSGLLQGMEEAMPLVTVFLDFWTPGDSITDKGAATKVLTYTCCMTSFAAVGFIGGEITAEKVAILALESFFGPFGLPKLIVVDDDPIFKGFFLQLFEFLGIPVKAVSKGNHRAARNEIFHKYLNKV